jgi:transmembrane sensor
MSSAQRHTTPNTAAGWFARVQAGALTEAERRDFEHWHNQSQDNALAYAQCEVAWELGAALEPEQSPAAIKPRQRGVNWRAWGALAASVMLCAAVLLNIGTESPQLYQTKIGEQRVVHLADGSSVMLNTNSALKVAYTRSQRDLILERGEAFFTVAKNPERPFVVDLGDTEVRALGTAFNIEKQHGNVEVAVTQGVVEVSAQQHFWQRAQRARLHPGQGVHLLAAEPDALTPINVDLERVTAWQASKLYFDDERLADALMEYNRYTKRQFVLVDDGLADQKISGVFNVGDDEALTFALKTSLGARILATDNRVLVLAEP